MLEHRVRPDSSPLHSPPHTMNGPQGHEQAYSARTEIRIPTRAFHLLPGTQQSTKIFPKESRNSAVLKVFFERVLFPSTGAKSESVTFYPETLMLLFSSDVLF